MNTLIARHLERQAAAKKRSEAERKSRLLQALPTLPKLLLTYRGVPYCKPCEIKIMYY